MATTRAAGLVIFRKVNSVVQYLMLQTSYGEHHWTPPKGHVDEGESDWETALRETQEEAGLPSIDLEIYQDKKKVIEYKVKGKPKSVVYWLAKLKDPQTEVKLSDEHIEFKWLPLQQAQEIAGYQQMQDLLAEFHVEVEKLKE